MNEKLWQELEIDFHLEAFKFPDNKIYGNVKIIPESSRKLIKKLIVSYFKLSYCLSILFFTIVSRQ
jgi:hypothetical protein